MKRELQEPECTSAALSLAPRLASSFGSRSPAPSSRSGLLRRLSARAASLAAPHAFGWVRRKVAVDPAEKDFRNGRARPSASSPATVLSLEEATVMKRSIHAAKSRPGALTLATGLAPLLEVREPRAESREPRAESREPRAESREPRAESREPRAESREPRAESREPRAESREPRAESREPRAESREPRAESREPRAESREPRAELRPGGTFAPRPHSWRVVTP